mmetsp:Transcript_2375/g.7152  ORF Transcript_2375/g.7152 Transcript_2375/m.7152 type:complete len:212 (+) Transcript_2375:299-934(+)
MCVYFEMPTCTQPGPLLRETHMVCAAKVSVDPAPQAVKRQFASRQSRNGVPRGRCDSHLVQEGVDLPLELIPVLSGGAPAVHEPAGDSEPNHLEEATGKGQPVDRVQQSRGRPQRHEGRERQDHRGRLLIILLPLGPKVIKEFVDRLRSICRSVIGSLVGVPRSIAGAVAVVGRLCDCDHTAEGHAQRQCRADACAERPHLRENWSGHVEQ